MSNSQHQTECSCGNEHFVFVKDLNMAAVWKTGNKFCRICSECGNRFFLSKSIYHSARDQYVILKGEDTPTPIYDCPACDESVTGYPESCPYCDTEYGWSEADIIDFDFDEAEETLPETTDGDESEEEDDEWPVPRLHEIDEDTVENMDYRTLREYGMRLDGVKGNDPADDIRDAMLTAMEERADTPEA